MHEVQWYSVFCSALTSCLHVFPLIALQFQSGRLLAQVALLPFQQDGVDAWGAMIQNITSFTPSDLTIPFVTGPLPSTCPSRYLSPSINIIPLSLQRVVCSEYFLPFSSMITMLQMTFMENFVLNAKMCGYVMMYTVQNYHCNAHPTVFSIFSLQTFKCWNIMRLTSRNMSLMTSKAIFNRDFNIQNFGLKN